MILGKTLGVFGFYEGDVVKFSLHNNINNNNNNIILLLLIIIIIIIINTFLYGAFTKLNAPTSRFIANKLEQKCRVE